MLLYLGRNCCEFNYDLYTRIVPKVPTKSKPSNGVDVADLMGGGKGRKKLKGGGASGGKLKGKKRQRSKSPPKKKKWLKMMTFAFKFQM